MTDYGKPTTAAEALDQEADELKYRETKYRADAGTLIAKADECRDIRDNLHAVADRYRKYQPPRDCLSIWPAAAGHPPGL